MRPERTSLPLRRGDHAKHVRAELTMEFLVCSLLEGCEGKDARIVRQNVEREGLLDFFKQSADIGGSREVSGWLRPCRRNF